MRPFRRPTIVESITIVAITAILGGVFLIPDSSTATRRRLERRARDWKRSAVFTLADRSLIAADASLTGEWTTRHHLGHTTFTFVRRTDGRYDVEFSTGGCLGGCNLSRIGTLSNGVIVLDGAVAEYMSPTYDTLYMIRIGNAEYLLPAESVREFEGERDAGTDDWKWYVHSRGQKSNKQSEVP